MIAKPAASPRAVALIGAAVVVVSLGAAGCRAKSLTDEEIYAICAKALACTPDLKRELPTQMDCAADVKKRIPSKDEPCHDVVNAYERCVLQHAACTSGALEAPACDREYQAKLKCSPALDAKF